MNRVNKADAMLKFNKNIYLKSPIYITSDAFWDGGIRADSSLREKAEFYYLAEKMSRIIKNMIVASNENVFIGKALCENEQLYAHWSDLEAFELFREVSQLFKPRQYYEISLPKDSGVIDLIVESNFRYFTHIALYLPKSNVIVLPTCHTEVIVYSTYPDKMIGLLNDIVAECSDEKYKIVCKICDATVL